VFARGRASAAAGHSLLGRSEGGVALLPDMDWQAVGGKYTVLRIMRRVGQFCDRWLVILLLAISLSCNVYLVRKLQSHAGRPGSAWAIGARIPKLAAWDSRGSAVAIDWAADGRPWVLYLFRPSCEWCRKNLDNIRLLGEQRGTQYHFVGLLASREDLERYQKDAGLPFPVYGDPRDASGKRFLITSTPETLIVSPNGRVSEVWLGAYQGPLLKQVEATMKLRLPGLGKTDSSPRRSM